MQVSAVVECGFLWVFIDVHIFTPKQALAAFSSIMFLTAIDNNNAFNHRIYLSVNEVLSDPAAPFQSSLRYWTWQAPPS